jgi:hypothetical protein
LLLCRLRGGFVGFAESALIVAESALIPVRDVLMLLGSCLRRGAVARLLDLSARPYAA